MCQFCLMTSKEAQEQSWSAGISKHYGNRGTLTYILTFDFHLKTSISIKKHQKKKEKQDKYKFTSW